MTSTNKRVTIFDNSNPAEGKLIMVPGHMGLQHFLQASGQKLGIQGRKAFLQDGGEIDDLQLVRDGDQVYISAGEAFHLAQKKANGQKFSQYSIAVMGPGSVGKSAMTLQYVQGVFVTDYDPTIEDAYRKNVAVDNEPAVLDILDTAGQEDYTALRNTWMRDRDAFLLVFSVTERTTFEDLKGFYEQLCVMHEEKLPPIIIAGNKCDLDDRRQVSAEEGKQLAAQWRAVAYLETSAKIPKNIDKAFGDLVRAIRQREAQKNKKASPKKPKFWSNCVVL